MKVFHFVPFYLCITVKLFEAMGIEVDDSLPLRLVLKYRNDFGKYSPARTRSDYRHDGVTLVDTLASNSKPVSTKQRIARIEVQRSELEVLLREIIADDDVEDLEEDHMMWKFQHLRNTSENSGSRARANSSRSIQEAVQNGMNMIQAPDVWDTSSREQNPIKICVVDTGYDLGHVDLPSKGITSTDTEFGTALKDGDGHGTHCAGIIGAIGGNGAGVVGVNPDPSAFSFHISKSLSDNGIGSSSTIMMGFQGCIDAGAKVISMSLGGGPKSNIASKLFKDAYEQDGVLVFAASGNSGTNRLEYPASYPHVISVGAVLDNESYAEFSNFNSQVELVGPGVHINSTDTGGGYDVLSGTSMAAPHVAGVAALIWSYFPECSNHQIRNVLIRTAKDLSPNSVGCNEKTGFGLVQAKAAYDLLNDYGCEAGGVDSASSSAIGGCNQISTMKTAAPTRRPTKQPTDLPTFRPTRQPTESPTFRQTKKPTENPTFRPTKKPTESPTFHPTNKPTERPSKSPTKAPTPRPSNRPSLSPSSLPSNEPSLSLEPSSSLEPSLSLEPSSTPTLTPSLTPSTPPSLDPTIEPSYKPSFSTIPSTEPSLQPSNLPSASTIPSSIPSAAPSGIPSSASSSPPSEQGCELFELDLLTDDSASDTLWMLERVEGENIGIIEIGPGDNRSLENEMFYEGASRHCLPEGKYVFTIYDIKGVGLQAPSYYEIRLHGASLAKCVECNFGYYDMTEFYSFGRGAVPPPSDDANWVDILVEDFDDGYGSFNGAPGYDVIYKNTAFDRNGLIRIQDGRGTNVTTGDKSSISAVNIPLHTFHSKFRIIFSFYAIFDADDRFCLDYSVGGGITWIEQKCWRGHEDFPNNMWVDDFQYEFWTSNTDKLSIRLRCAADSNFDDIYIDKVNLQGWTNTPFSVFPLFN